MGSNETSTSWKQEWPLGTAIVRKLDGKTHRGSVKAFDSEEGYYTVHYAEEDYSEDIAAEEMKKYVVVEDNHDKQKKKRPRPSHSRASPYDSEEETVSDTSSQSRAHAEEEHVSDASVSDGGDSSEDEDCLSVDADYDLDMEYLHGKKKAPAKRKFCHGSTLSTTAIKKRNRNKK